MSVRSDAPSTSLSHQQYLNKCNECNPGEARRPVPMRSNGDSECLHLPDYDNVWALGSPGHRRRWWVERMWPTPDIIQILSLKTNNQMQSYSPLALSLSYQSSLPEKTSSVFTYIYTSRGISSYLPPPQLCIIQPETPVFPLVCIFYIYKSVISSKYSKQFSPPLSPR